MCSERYWAELPSLPGTVGTVRDVSSDLWPLWACELILPMASTQASNTGDGRPHGDRVQQDQAAMADVLIAADNLRISRRHRQLGNLIIGGTLVIASLLIWPRALFALASSVSVGSIVLSILGLGIAVTGALVVLRSQRRLAALGNNYQSSGKPNSGLSNEPNLQMPTVGVGHGSPMDPSIAQFANPNKMIPGRRL